MVRTTRPGQPLPTQPTEAPNADGHCSKTQMTTQALGGVSGRTPACHSTRPGRVHFSDQELRHQKGKGLESLEGPWVSPWASAPLPTGQAPRRSSSQILPPSQQENRKAELGSQRQPDPEWRFVSQEEQASLRKSPCRPKRGLASGHKDSGQGERKGSLCSVTRHKSPCGPPSP